MASGVAPSRLAAFTLAPARISRSAVSRSSRYTAQCSAVAPSTCGALTSAFCCSSVRSGGRVALHRRVRDVALAGARLTSAVRTAPARATQPTESIRPFIVRHAVGLRCFNVLGVHELREPARAVALLLLVDAVHVQDAQQQIAGRHRLPLVRQVAVALAAGRWRRRRGCAARRSADAGSSCPCWCRTASASDRAACRRRPGSTAASRRSTPASRRDTG